MNIETRIARPHAAPNPEAGWETIETAPKTGERIDVWLGDADEDDLEFYCEVGTRASKGWYWLNGRFRPYIGEGESLPTFIVPTHWRKRQGVSNEDEPSHQPSAVAATPTSNPN